MSGKHIFIWGLTLVMATLISKYIGDNYKFEGLALKKRNDE